MPPCNAEQVIYSPRSRDCDCDQSTMGVVSSSSAGRGDHPGSWCDGEKKPRAAPSRAPPSEEARISDDERAPRGRRRIFSPVLSDRAAIAWFATLTAASFVMGCVARYYMIAMRNDEFRREVPLLAGRIRDPPVVSERRDLFRDAHPPRRHRPPPRHMAGDTMNDVGPAPSLDVAARDVLRRADHLDWDRYHRSDRPEVSGGGFLGGCREALVHPAMFAHPNPRSVGLVGMSGDDCRSALVEVLRHRTVEEVTLIGCEEGGGAATWAEEEGSSDVGSFLRNEVNRWSVAGDGDARTWFTDNVAALSSGSGNGSEKRKDPNRGSRFDVVILDLRSLGREAWREVLRLAAHSLTAFGVVVIPLGESPSRGDPPLHGGDRYYAGVTEAMVNVDKFETFGVYEESRGELGRPSSFLLACLDDCDYGWYSNEAQVNAMIHGRIDSCPDHDDDFHASSILTEFDGATMGGYQRPPKAWETVYCRRRPTPSDCLHMAGFDPAIPNAPASLFEVKTEDANVGRGVFATEAIPAGSYVMQEKGVQSVQFPPKTSDTLERLVEGLPEEAGELRAVTRYMYGYGFESWVMGDMGNFVDSSISTFTNHGCNGTYNTAAVNIMPQISRGIILSEYNADPANMPWLEEEGDRFNPVMLRHLESYWTKNQRTFRDIRRGDEVLENYLFFTQCDEEWVETVRELKAMCSGDEIGLVVLRDSSAGENASVET